MTPLELLLLTSAAAIGLPGLVWVLTKPRTREIMVDTGRAAVAPETVPAVAPETVPAGEPVAPLIGTAPAAYAFVDLETTGLDTEEDRIIEIAVVIPAAGASLQHGLATLVNPGRLLTPFITNYTGITNEMLLAAPSSDILHNYFDLIGDRTVCAYNAEFDLGFLQAAARRLGRPFSNAGLCVMQMVRERHPNLRSYKLTDVCEAFDISVEGSPHRAMADVERAFRVGAAILNGKQPNESAVKSTDYAVYGHYSEDGRLFYVWTARPGQSNAPENDTLWAYYVENHLAQKYEIRCLTEGITLRDAIDIKASLLEEHAHTVLNRVNSFRGNHAENLAQYHALNKSHWQHRERAKFLEKADPEAAIVHYQRAMKQYNQLMLLVTAPGLFGKLDHEVRVRSGGYQAVQILDRISLLLCRLGRPEEAQAAAEACFELFRGPAASKEAEAVRRRIAKALQRKHA